MKDITVTEKEGTSSSHIHWSRRSGRSAGDGDDDHGEYDGGDDVDGEDDGDEEENFDNHNVCSHLLHQLPVV